ncbi:MAG TPA: OmpA family protein [Gemmataceae bacterium]|nr:OmpA family protein [Gemmataceae bacterium]
MFRATGAGKVQVILDNGAGSLEALLYNFDFDDFIGRQFRPLKAEHTKFLDEKVLGLLANDRSAIWLQGRASRIGTNAWNMETSMTRASRVQAYLYDNGVSVDQVQPDAIGEEGAATHAEDDERDRSVLLWVYPKFKDDPKPPPRRVPPRPKVSRHFKLAMLTGISVSQSAKIAKFLRGKVARGVAVDAIFFIVWDTTNNLSCIYVYVGLGLGVGLSFTPKVSATTHGPWNSFTTSKPIGVWQFGRWSRFTSAGTWNWSLNWITIETPRGVANVYERIDTGTTLGAGASTTVGDFIRIEGPSPFTGP